jgi:predicted ATP-grasp superfamily ATP-dependent carboligase
MFFSQQYTLFNKVIDWITFPLLRVKPELFGNWMATAGRRLAPAYNDLDGGRRNRFCLRETVRARRRMKLFLYEHFCSGALAGNPGVESLRAEGWAMLSAVLDDACRCPGVNVDTLIDFAAPQPGWVAPANVTPHEGGSTHEQTFRTLARVAEVTLVIAPEFDGLLEKHCRWAEEEGGRLLGPSSVAVRRTSDKLTLARYLHDHGIPTPPCARSPGEWEYPVVCKPRDGAGSQATFLLQAPAELKACLDRARLEGWQGEMIVQPFVPGLPASVALLLGPGQCVALPAAAQHLSNDGQFHYLGGSLPLEPALDARARRLAERAVRAVEGLNGYVGVDLVLGGPADGTADVVIEINPRLTTSYVGLRELARFNLAEALLAVTTGAPLPAMGWRAGPVHFLTDGRIL